MSSNEDLLLRLNEQIMCLDPNHPPMSRHPQVHNGMNPVIMTISAEMQYLKQLSLEERRRKLKQLQVNDFLQQDRELRRVDQAFINNHQ